MLQVNIKDYEDYLYELYGKFGEDRGLFMKLVEEVGEVSEVLIKRAGYKASNSEDIQTQLANELVDVIHYAAAIAAVNRIDLNEFIVSKDKKAAIKYNHERSLEEYILSKKD